MRALLIATYELGRQPFGLASPAAWLRSRGVEVRCQDLSREALDEAAVRAAELIAFHVPMHTATRLAVAALPAVRRMNPRAHICFYGLYAPVNEAYLRRLGVQSIIGGEFEGALTALAERIGKAHAATETGAPAISLERLEFITPERAGLPPLESYARLVMPGGERRVAGYTEASRGCKHLCRHCPIVPVYNGAFRIVPRGVVIEDIRRQVAAGAQHITFGDPDFFNGIGHALPIVDELHRTFPQLTYDATIKVEHLLKHREHLRTLRETGCLFVTSAVESVDDAVLDRLDKRHTRAEFLEALALCRAAGLAMQPTFVPFTPWTTLEGYAELLGVLREEGLVESVAPIQLAIRLLIPAGSRLLELEEIRSAVGAFDETALVYPWKNADERVDRLCDEVQRIVHAGEKGGLGRARIFEEVAEAAQRAAGGKPPDASVKIGLRAMPLIASRATVPYLNEPWYC
ncbi:MAG TPA: CUAEP/CCAEP-tail radical SAM protein [Candidatus Acidoferrales bacterium]|nr:CUAEP/CCAEP-tail radical SAM protein [Candidatus Acidoferrales bacterium]